MDSNDKKLPTEIVHFNTLRIEYGNRKSCECENPQYVIDNTNKIVRCDKCGALVEPFVALTNIAERYDREVRYLEYLRDERQKLEEWQVEVTAIKHALLGSAIAEVKEFDGVPLDRLRELAQADKEGRCIISPCKVGDIVYIINRDSKNSIGKYEVTTSEIDIHKYKITDIVKRDYEFWADEVGGGYIVTFSKESFGKTVFFTREEAEEALTEADNETN